MAEILGSGIKKENICIIDMDTYSDKDENGNYSFHSYRRDHNEWRNIAILTGETKE